MNSDKSGTTGKEEGYGPRRLKDWSTLRLDVARGGGGGRVNAENLAMHACRRYQTHQVHPPGNAQLAAGMLGEYQKDGAFRQRRGPAAGVLPQASMGTAAPISA